MDDRARPVGLVDRACAVGRGEPKRALLKVKPSSSPEALMARAMARPAPDRSTH